MRNSLRSDVQEMSSVNQRTLRNEVKRFENDLINVLASFEKAKDWADLSSCLTRMQKSITKPPPEVTSIPFRDVVAKRLGQCLNPTLPAGVHGKCLDVYRVIFLRIQSDNIILELGLWTPGLFSVFHYAAICIRPQFLDLIDDFFVPLGIKLQPCLTGLLVSLLSGMDVTGSDVHNRVMKLLRTISDDCVGTAALMYSLWVVMNRTSSIRLPALHVLVMFLPDGHVNNLPEEALDVYLPNTSYDLVARTFEKLLRDEDILVRRQFFDFIVSDLPLNSYYFTLRQQKVALLRASFQIILSLDWSFERRFLQWINGQTNVHDGVNVTFFETYVVDDLCLAMKQQLSSESTLVNTTGVPFPFNLLQLLHNNVPQFVPLVLSRITIPLWVHIIAEPEERREHLLVMLRNLLRVNPLFLDASWGALYHHINACLSDEKPSSIFIDALRQFLYFWDDQYRTTMGNSHQLGDSTLVAPGSPQRSCEDQGSVNACVVQDVRFRHLQFIVSRCLRAQMLWLSSESIELEGCVVLMSLTLQSLSRFSVSEKMEFSEVFQDVIKLFLGNITGYITIISEVDDSLACQALFQYFNDILLFLFILCHDEVAKALDGIPSVIGSALLEGCSALINYCVQQVTTPSKPNWLAVKLFASLCWEHNVIRDIYANPSSCTHVVYVQLITGTWNHLLEDCSEMNGVLGCTYTHVGKLLLRLGTSERGLYQGDSLMKLLISELSSLFFETKCKAFRKFLILWGSSTAPNSPCSGSRRQRLGTVLLSISYKMDLRCYVTELRKNCNGVAWDNAHIFSSAMRLILECLDAPQTTLRSMSRSWLLIASERHLPCIIDSLLEELLDLLSQSDAEEPDTERTVYLIGVLASCLLETPCAVLLAMYRHPVTPSLLERYLTVCATSYSRVAVEIDEQLELNLSDGQWGYDASGVVVDYVDLCCALTLQFINGLDTYRGGASQKNHRVRSAAFEFLLRLLSRMEKSSNTLQQNKAIYMLLAPPLLRLLDVSLSQSDLVLHVHVVQLLSLIFNELSFQDISHLKEERTAWRQSPQRDQTIEKVTKRGIEINIYEEKYKKDTQLRLLPVVLNGALDTLVDAVGAMLKLVAFTPYNALYASYFSSLKSIIEFVVLVMRRISDFHSQYQMCQQRFVSFFISCLTEDVTAEHVYGLSHVLYGLSLYISFLADPLEECTTPLKETSSVNDTWPSMFPFNWFNSTENEHSPANTQGNVKRCLLNSFTFCIMGSLTLVLQKLNISTLSDTSPYLHRYTKKKQSLDLIVFDLLQSNALPERLESEPSTKDCITLRHLYGHAAVNVLSLLKRSPEHAVVALAVLLDMPLYSNGLQQFMSTIITSDVINFFYTRLIVSIITDTLFPKSVQNAPSDPPQTLTWNFPRNFVVEESTLLSLLSFILSHLHTSCGEANMKHLQRYISHLLESVVITSNNALSFVWIFIILIQLDQRLPFDKDVAEDHIDKKRMQRNFLELIRILMCIVMKQYRTNTSAQRSVKSSYPPCCIELLSRILTSTDATAACFSQTSELDPRVVDNCVTYLIQRESQVAASLVALTAFILVNRHTRETKITTWLTTTLLKTIAKYHWKPLFQSICSSTDPDALVYRYLGLSLITTLPYGVIPLCMIPAQKITYELVHCAGYEGSLSFKRIFTDVPVTTQDGTTVLLAYDQRCFKALSNIVRIAVETDADTMLSYGQVLTAPRSIGIFSFRDSELSRRIGDLKRISFILLCCPPNFYNSCLSAISTRIIEALHFEKQTSLASEYANSLKVQALLCFRILCFRTSPGLLNSLWPIVLTELIQVFSLELTPKNFSLILATLKVVDLAIVLDIPEFHLHQWIFINDGCSGIHPYDTPFGDGETKSTPRFVSLCSELAQRQTENESSQDGVQKQSSLATSRMSNPSYRRPLVTEYDVSTAMELKAIARRLNENGVKSYFTAQQIDEETLLRCIESDLLHMPPGVLDNCREYFSAI